MLTVLHSTRAILATAALAGLLLVRVAADVPAPATVTIFHFNDVYEIDAVEGGRAGGLSRAATVLARLKRGATPVVSTLGGDFLSPSAIGTAQVDGQPLAGRQMVAMLNAVGLDWATFGNHEFDVAESAFHQRIAESRFKYVSSNVVDAAGKPFDATPQSAVVSVRSNGRPIRLGLIGLTIDANRKPWVQYLPPIDSAKTQVAALRGKVDAIVALTHLALPTDQALVEAVPEIDVVLGGHEHENWMIRRGPLFAPIVKADANVRSVAIVALNFGKPGARPSVSSRLEVLDSHVAQDKRVEAEAQKWIAQAFDAFKSQGFVPEAPVVTITEPLDGRESTIRNRSNELTAILVGKPRPRGEAGRRRHPERRIDSHRRRVAGRADSGLRHHPVAAIRREGTQSNVRRRAPDVRAQHRRDQPGHGRIPAPFVERDARGRRLAGGREADRAGRALCRRAARVSVDRSRGQSGLSRRARIRRCTTCRSFATSGLRSSTNCERGTGRRKARAVQASSVIAFSG